MAAILMINVPYAGHTNPTLPLVQHVDVFLTHCGMNSMNEAMNYGVPMLAMPFINEQIASAKQIVELGIGKRVRSFPSSGRQLYKTVKEVYNDKHIRTRSMEVQNLLKREATLEEVVRIIN